MRRLADKLAHIDAALDGGSEVSGTGRPGSLELRALRFRPTALPECDLDEVDPSLELLGKRIAAPFMVAPMTGGVERGGELNRRMARSAEAVGIPFGVGSQRVALEVPERARDFRVREVAPSIPVFGNLGAVQLVKGYGPDDAWRAVEMVEADALYLHLNAMQEVVQEGGDTAWSGVLTAIESVCSTFEARGGVPVFAREVGFGLDRADVRRLLAAGIAGLDCAGGGGTSWSKLEGRVAASERHQRLGEVFQGWGLTTAEAVLEVRGIDGEVPLLASGGVRTGLDVMRLVRLGATAAGLASPVIRAASESEEACVGFLEDVLAEVKATMFGCGCPTLPRFRRDARFYLGPDLAPADFPR